MNRAGKTITKKEAYALLDKAPRSNNPSKRIKNCTELEAAIAMRTCINMTKGERLSILLTRQLYFLLGKK